MDAARASTAVAAAACGLVSASVSASLPSCSQSETDELVYGRL